MALNRVKTFISDEILTASDLNAEIDNILNNATSLISPVTAALDLNGFALIGDSDGDSSLTWDTDDQMDVRLGGTDVAAWTTKSLKMNQAIAWQTTEYTIASGAITPVRGLFTVDTESDAATDNLDQIVTTNYEAGSVIHVLAENASRVVTVRNAQGAAGQIHTKGNRNIDLSTENPLVLQRSGADWYEVLSTGVAPVLLATSTASNDASIDFTAGTWSNFSYIEMRLQNVVPASDSAIPYIRFSTDGGSTWDNATGRYRWVYWAAYDNTTSGVTADQSDTEIELASAVGSTGVAESGVSGVLTVGDPANGSQHAMLDFQGSIIDASAGLVGTFIAAARYNVTTAVDGIQFLFSTGNVESGKLQLWGIP